LLCKLQATVEAELVSN